jgi:hypothetical protein
VIHRQADAVRGSCAQRRDASQAAKTAASPGSVNTIASISARAPGLRRYPSDLTDAHWALVESLLSTATRRGRVRAHPRRDLVNAIL